MTFPGFCVYSCFEVVFRFQPNDFYWANWPIRLGPPFQITCAKKPVRYFRATYKFYLIWIRFSTWPVSDLNIHHRSAIHLTISLGSKNIFHIGPPPVRSQSRMTRNRTLCAAGTSGQGQWENGNEKIYPSLCCCSGEQHGFRGRHHSGGRSVVPV